MSWISRFFKWNNSRKALDRLNTAMLFALQWEERAKGARHALVEDRLELTAIEMRLEKISARLDVDLKMAEDVDKQHREAIDALRSELKIVSEVSMPVLVASHKLLLQRYESEIAIEAKKMAMVSPD